MRSKLVELSGPVSDCCGFDVGLFYFIYVHFFFLNGDALKLVFGHGDRLPPRQCIQKGLNCKTEVLVVNTLH